MNGSRNHELQTLTLHSSVLVLLRTLYRMVLDYCVLKPSGDSGSVVVFTKDQLISLIERSSPDIAVGDIPDLAVRGLFRPVSISDRERVQVLVVGEAGADVMPAGKALTATGPSFPAWWEVPVALALKREGKLYFNPTALAVFPHDLKKIAVRDLPDRDEFMVKLEGGGSVPGVIAFRRLEKNVFMLEDCTGDIAAAEEISWWAAVGRAWAEMLDREKRKYRRCDEAESQALHAAYEVLPCEWDGELRGYFCVEKAANDISRPEVSPKKGVSRVSKTAHDRKNIENTTLTTLGPQAMGLLAPGTNCAPFGEAVPETSKKNLRKAESKGGKEKSNA